MSNDYDIIKAIGEMCEYSDSLHTHHNTDREKMVVNVGQSIGNTVRGSNIRIETVLNKPFKSMGYVSICGKKVVIKDTVKFVALLQTADNVEMYAHTDGTVQIDLGYHRLMY